MYVPKKDITWRRTVTGPYWDTLTGREKEPVGPVFEHIASKS